jgi:hypothetical protein
MATLAAKAAGHTSVYSGADVNSPLRADTTFASDGRHAMYIVAAANFEIPAYLSLKKEGST